MKNSGPAMALILALAPFGAATARAQQPPRAAAEPRTQICINGRCTDDTTRVVVVRLMNKVDSLQRIFLGQPISPEQRVRMKSQIEDMIRQLTDLQRSAVAFGLQQADEATRAAMAGAAQGFVQLQVTPDAVQEAAPKGWIGLTFVGAPMTDVRDGEYFVRFLDYPEVETVEPASPAERAGIARGDLLMALNGQDVTSHSISMTRLLQPERRIVVRLEHNGQPHDYSLIVAKAPQTFVMRMGDFSVPPPPSVATAPTAPTAGAAIVPDRPRATVPNPVTWTGSSFNFDSEHAPVAGAEMSTLNPDLARNLNLGVDHGVLVISAPADTPAAEAGLRSADVIVTVAGDEITSVRELRRALERHRADSVFDMQIVRERHRQTLKINNND